MTYIVYSITDPRNREIFYIGYTKSDKKNPTRFSLHLREAKTNDDRHKNMHKVNRIRSIQKDGVNPYFDILCSFEARADAIEKEIELIAHYGRRDLGTGCLTNLTDGGEGANGKIYTDEERRFKSLQTKGERNGMFGKKHTEETLRAMTENHNHGYTTITEGHREAIRRSNTKLKTDIAHSVEHNQKIGQSLIGKTKGRSKPIEMRQKLSEARTGKVYDTKQHPWYHPTHGDEVCSRHELADKYPDHNLNLANLCRVAGGHNLHHKGWRLNQPSIIYTFLDIARATGALICDAARSCVFA